MGYPACRPDPGPIRCQRGSSGRAHKLVLQVLGGHVLALRQLEHVLDAVHHAQAAVRRQLAHIAGVEEAVAICPAQRRRSAHCLKRDHQSQS